MPGCYRVVGSIQRMASSETSSAELHDCDGKRSCMLVFFCPFYACSYCAFWGQAALTGACWPHCQTDTLPVDGKGEFQGTDPTRLFRRSTSTTGSKLSARSPRYPPLGPIEEEIKETVDGWMSSLGHRDNLLNKHHRKVNFGLAWDEYNPVAYQHFEGNYMEYDQLPAMKDYVLQLDGRAQRRGTVSRRQPGSPNTLRPAPAHPTDEGTTSKNLLLRPGSARVNIEAAPD